MWRVMDNPEEILHSLEEFSKMKPKDIPRELEEYLWYVAKTGNPVYQWPTIKSLFREKLIKVITEFYESCPSVEIPPCPNVEIFNYELMKNFILEKLDTFSSAPFTVQRICELLTTPRKEYNRIDKYMRALEKNILVVSTTEPGRRSAENGEGIMNGIESEHMPEGNNSSHDINVEEMDEAPTWPRIAQVGPILFENESGDTVKSEQNSTVQGNFENDNKSTDNNLPNNPVKSSSEADTVITHSTLEDEPETPYVTVDVASADTIPTQKVNTEEDVKEDTENIPIVASTLPEESKVERLGNESSAAEKEEETEKSNEVNHEDVSSIAEQHEITVEDQILAEVSSSEILDEKTASTSEETNIIVQEQSGIENISPENSSLSPETLQAETNTEYEKLHSTTESKETQSTEKTGEISTSDEKSNITNENQPDSPANEENAADSTILNVIEEQKEEIEKIICEKETSKEETEKVQTNNKSHEESEETLMDVDMGETEIEKKLLPSEPSSSVNDDL